MTKTEPAPDCIHHWKCDYDGYGHSKCYKCKVVKDDYDNLYWGHIQFPLGVRSPLFIHHEARYPRETTKRVRVQDFKFTADDNSWDDRIRILEG